VTDQKLSEELQYWKDTIENRKLKLGENVLDLANQIDSVFGDLNFEGAEFDYAFSLLRQRAESLEAEVEKLNESEKLLKSNLDIQNGFYGKALERAKEAESRLRAAQALPEKWRSFIPSSGMEGFEATGWTDAKIDCANELESALGEDSP
jgi:hypothetical protein